MKTVFKFIAACSFAAGLAAAPARADQTFWTTRALLGDASFFGRSEKVGFQQFNLTPELRAHIEARLGYHLPRDRYTVFVATTGAHVDGYALFDDEPGQHLPITFAVKISP